MLRPSKHSHPDRTVVSLALVLLTRLRQKRVENFSQLRTFAKRTVSGGDVLFLSSVNLLFLLGVIEYRPKTDAFEYRPQNETV